MDFTPQPTFLLALNEIMKTDVAAITFTQEELFFLANDLCPKDQRVRYGAYLKFMDSLDAYGEPSQPHEQADLFMEINDYIRAQKIKQKLIMFKGIMDADKDWRRYQWLLQWQEKQERQDNAQTRQLAKVEKEKQQALDALAQYTQPAMDGQPVVTPSPNNQPSYHQQQHLSKVN